MLLASVALGWLGAGEGVPGLPVNSLDHHRLGVWGKRYRGM